jgi:hypothetical protein
LSPIETSVLDRVARMDIRPGESVHPEIVDGGGVARAGIEQPTPPSLSASGVGPKTDRLPVEYRDRKSSGDFA